MLTITNIIFFAIFLASFLALNYMVFAHLGYWFFYRFLGPKIPHRKILEATARPGQMILEKKRSLTTQVVFFFMGIGLYVCYQLKLTQIYFDWKKYGVIYFFLSFFIMHQLHDAYFYWTHRLMHKINWLKKFHFIHHQSSPPTPFSALSFHPVEAFIQGFFWYLISFLVPMPSFWIFGFYSFMFYINMWGHTSFEFWHKDLLTHPFLRILNTPTHHNLHHKYHDFNYSIYYNFWDSIAGTNHPKYKEHYLEVKKRSEAAKTSKILKAMKL